MTKTKTIEVKGRKITIITVGNEDYISITDMLKAKDGDFLSPIGCETETPLSFWVFGKVFTIPILIMANMP